VKISVGLEQGPDGWTFAHGLSLPGCVALGRTPEAAVEAFPPVLSDWLRFLGGIGERVPPTDQELEIAVDEWLATDADVAAGQSDVCFAADLRTLSDEEIQQGLRVLGDLRGMLLAPIRRVRDAGLDPDTRRILEELARAQWWLLSRLGASPLAGPQDRTLARLDTAIALVVQHFTELAPERRGQRLVLEGEEWTPRKVLRRLLWLEWALGRAALHALAPKAEGR
jgi:hypothetical protein